MTEVHAVGLVCVGQRHNQAGKPTGKRYLAGCSCRWSFPHPLPREEAIHRAMEHHREYNGARTATKSTTGRSATSAGTRK